MEQRELGVVSGVEGDEREAYDDGDKETFYLLYDE